MVGKWSARGKLLINEWCGETDCGGTISWGTSRTVLGTDDRKEFSGEEAADRDAVRRLYHAIDSVLVVFLLGVIHSAFIRIRVFDLKDRDGIAHFMGDDEKRFAVRTLILLDEEQTLR